MAKKNPVETLIEIIVLALLLPVMFWVGLFTGIGYLLAIGFAIKSKILFRKKRMARLIILGTLLSTLAGILLFLALDQNTAGHATSAIIILAIAGYIWYKGFKMRRGR